MTVSTSSPPQSATSQSAAARRAGPTAETDFGAAFERFAGERSTAEAAWLQTARKAAQNRYASNGLPSRKNEQWRYSNLNAFARRTFALPPSSGPASSAPTKAAREAAAAHRLPGSEAMLVFIDGVYSEELSLTSTAVRLTPIAPALAPSAGAQQADVERLVTSLAGDAQRPFLDLNTSFFTDGATLSCSAGTKVEGPIQLLFLHTGVTDTAAVFPRVIVVMEPASRATLVEEHVGLGAGGELVAPVTQVHVQDGAELRHVRVQDAAPATFHFASVDVTLDKDAAWRGVSLQLGAALAREEVRVSYAGNGGDCELHALGLSDGERTADVQVDVVHSSQNCKSRQTYRGIVDDKGRGVFNSRVAVERDAQGSDTGQSSKSLLLSDSAVADTKPQLEVLADDVKCFHGATVGQLDHDALFFLRSRGIDAAQARALLTRAFAGEVVEAIPVLPLRERMEALLQDRLARTTA